MFSEKKKVLRVVKQPVDLHDETGLSALSSPDIQNGPLSNLFSHVAPQIYGLNFPCSDMTGLSEADLPLDSG